MRQISNLSFFVILKYNKIQTDFSLVYDWNTSETPIKQMTTQKVGFLCDSYCLEQIYFSLYGQI